MHDSKKCPNCGACKECGAAPVKMIPYPVPMPYPVYPQPWSQPWTAPYRPAYPTWTVSGTGTSGYGISQASGTVH